MTQTNPPPVKLPPKIMNDPELLSFFQQLTQSLYLLWRHSRNASLTTALTTITHTSPGTPDYAIQNMTNSSPYGFVTQDEANTVLSVIANLQARVNELENHLTGA